MINSLDLMHRKYKEIQDKYHKVYIKCRSAVSGQLYRRGRYLYYLDFLAPSAPARGLSLNTQGNEVSLFLKESNFNWIIQSAEKPWVCCLGIKACKLCSSVCLLRELEMLCEKEQPWCHCSKRPPSQHGSNYRGRMKSEIIVRLGCLCISDVIMPNSLVPSRRLHRPFAGTSTWAIHPKQLLWEFLINNFPCCSQIKWF